jgi:hypothetical protein
MTELMYIAIAGLVYMLSNELEDRSIKNRWEKWTGYLNTATSWKNKYDLNKEGNLKPYIKKWYHFGIHPAYAERFPFSTTLFVFVTDGEHLFQFVKNIAILTGFLIIGWQVAAAWLVGSKAGSFIKELIKKIQ